MEKQNKINKLLDLQEKINTMLTVAIETLKDNEIEIIDIKDDSKKEIISQNNTIPEILYLLINKFILNKNDKSRALESTYNYIDNVIN